MGILTGILMGLFFTVVGIFKSLCFIIIKIAPFLLFYPTMIRKINKDEDSETIVLASVGWITVILFTSLFCLAAWLGNYHYLWGLYGLYTLAGLGVLHFFSLMYEIGRHYGKKRFEKREAERARRKTEKKHQEIPDYDDWTAAISDLGPMHEKGYKKLMKDIEESYNAGKLDESQHTHLTNMLGARLRAYGKEPHEI